MPPHTPYGSWTVNACSRQRSMTGHVKHTFLAFFSRRARLAPRSASGEKKTSLSAPMHAPWYCHSYVSMSGSGSLLTLTMPGYCPRVALSNICGSVGSALVRQPLGRGPDSLTGMTEPRVLTEIDGPIAYVWLNRPDKLNGVDLELITELIAAAEALKSNRDIRAVVLQGKGRSFCAGLDFGAAFKDKKRVARFFFAGPRSLNRFQKVTAIWRSLPVPVIAVVQGHCYGAGVQLAA